MDAVSLCDQLTKLPWGRSLNIYHVSLCFTVAPVRQEICRYRWKKSTNAFEAKMCQCSLGINQSCFNRSRVQIILRFNTTKTSRIFLYFYSSLGQLMGSSMDTPFPLW